MTMNNNQNRFTKIGALLFALIGVVHLVRVIYGWVVVFNGTTIPIWTSILGLIVAAIMSHGLWKESR